MSEEQMSFDDPSLWRRGLVRNDHPDTSRVAAVRSAPRNATQRGRLLVLIHDAGDRGLTAFEAEDRMRSDFPWMRTVRPRLVELRDEGWIMVDQRTRTNDLGLAAQVNVFNPEAEGDYQRWVSR
jgi:hypothetical protein